MKIRGKTIFETGLEMGPFGSDVDEVYRIDPAH